MGRCKPLGSLNSLLSYTPQLRKQETNGVSLSTLRSGRWLLLVFPQLLSNHLWVSGSICWISVLGALGCPGGSAGKEPTCNVGDLGSILGLGRSPREENGYPLQYSGLENSMDGGAWESTTHGVAKSWTWAQLSDFRFYSYLEAGNCWWLWHFLIIDMVGDIFISQCGGQRTTYIELVGGWGSLQHPPERPV